MSKLFKSVTSEKDNGWMQCSFGHSGIDSNDYVLTTHYLKADEVPNEMNDAKSASQMIAGLLNAYYMGINVQQVPVEKILAMGVIEEEDSYNPNQKPLF